MWWHTITRAYQSSGIELLLHLLWHFCRLIENKHLQTPNLIVCRVDNSIYNFSPHFDCHVHKQGKFYRILFYFLFLYFSFWLSRLPIKMRSVQKKQGWYKTCYGIFLERFGRIICNGLAMNSFFFSHVDISTMSFER